MPEHAAERLYSDEFFKGQRAAAQRSARAVVPLVLKTLAPKSVIDVGSGTGTWLAAFLEHGITDVFGVDGDYVDRHLLEIPGELFLPFDLTKPLRLERSFDLVMSLEVAEHLSYGCAGPFVESLTRLGPAVLFSAAIPYQGGTSHLNEQWPEFWAAHFAERGFVAIDFLRRRIWNHPDVSWWYAQNLLLYVSAEYSASHPALRVESEQGDPSVLSLVHPVGYLKAVGWERRVGAAAADLLLVPEVKRFLWIDQGEAPEVAAQHDGAVPFPQRDGQYAGPPEDGTTALSELNRMRQEGIDFAVFAWPAFWWLEYYQELAAHLRSKCRCVIENDRLAIFDLR